MKKDDLPYMPFYIGDWFKAPDVQSLSFEDKGIWFEMLCYMWESKERGYLINNNGCPYSISELSRLMRLPEDLLKQKVKQLLDFGVASSRESDGAIYSRKMVRDQEIRKIRQKAGKKGGIKSFASRFAQANAQANTDIDIDIENDIDIKKILDLINTEIPEATGSNQVTSPILFQRLDSFLQTYPTFQDIEIWKQYLSKVKESDFLMGRGDEVKQPPLAVSWICDPKNAMDVMDGKYKNRLRRANAAPRILV
ncbi:MAG: hypothetical protein FJ119_10770 [Deltaproteobacteria bacterium]|nr:hypothetical protein [Deltaproteobacteria bacterium]